MGILKEEISQRSAIKNEQLKGRRAIKEQKHKELFNIEQERINKIYMEHKPEMVRMHKIFKSSYKPFIMYGLLYFGHRRKL